MDLLPLIILKELEQNSYHFSASEDKTCFKPNVKDLMPLMVSTFSFICPDYELSISELSAFTQISRAVLKALKLHWKKN